jgi:hypothetical protein
VEHEAGGIDERDTVAQVIDGVPQRGIRVGFCAETARHVERLPQVRQEPVHHGDFGILHVALRGGALDRGDGDLA